MKKMNENQLQNLEAGKFFGSKKVCGPDIELPGGSCIKNCTVKYYAFWIVVASSPSEPESC